MTTLKRSDTQIDIERAVPRWDVSSDRVVRDITGSSTLQAGRHKRERKVLRVEPGKDDSTTGMKNLTLVDAVAAGVRAIDYIPTKRSSPWETLQRIYELKLDDFITVAVQKDLPCGLVMVKQFNGASASEKVTMIKSLHHENFLNPLECFQFQGVYHVVFIYVPISLDQIVTSLPYPTELQLAAILGQILNGIAYIASKGLQHGSLSCSNVLLDSYGVVKISGQEHCRNLESSSPKGEDIRGLGRIAMELMQKYLKDDGATGVDDLARWPSDSDAVGFLSMTTSETSAKDLMKHPFIKCPWRREDLRWMVALSEISVARRFKFLL